MFCSRSIGIHLLRGAGAIMLIGLGLVLGSIWLWPPLILGAVLLLRGCPMCWLVGLFETIGQKRSRRVGEAAG